MVWAFIFKDENIDAAKAHTRLDYDGVTLLIYGVSTIDEGALLAKRLWEEERCELVELCGGFKPEGARRVIELTGGQVRVGYVTKLPFDAVQAPQG